MFLTTLVLNFAKVYTPKRDTSEGAEDIGEVQKKRREEEILVKKGYKEGGVSL